MISRNDIETIEHLFEQYCSYQSEIMFNYHTDNFFDNLLSLDFANEIISDLTAANPIEDKLFKKRQCTEWFSFYEDIICHGHLLVFTETELMFQNIPAGITVLTAYVGDKTPSKRDKAMMLDFYINHPHTMM